MTGTPLAGLSVVITRPVGAHGALARAVRRLGGLPLTLPGARIEALPHDAAMAQGLKAATGAQVLVFQSPNAVRGLYRAAPDWQPRARATVVAIGPGTARALARHGLSALTPAKRHDSEGVLALAALQGVHGKRVVLVGAPGGRDLLAAALRARGARLALCHVYRRAPPRYDRRHRDALLAAPPPLAWLVSSAEAVDCVRRWADADCWRRLAGAHAIAPSARVAAHLRALGATQVAVAGSAAPAAMVAALSGPA